MCFERQRIPKHLLLQPTLPVRHARRRRLRWMLPRALMLVLGIAMIYFYANAHASSAAAPGPALTCQHIQD